MEFALITFCVLFVTSHSWPRDFLASREIATLCPTLTRARIIFKRSGCQSWSYDENTFRLNFPPPRLPAALVGRKLCKLAFNYLNNATQLHRHNETAGNSHRPGDKCLQSRVQISFGDNLINSNDALSLKASPVGPSTGPEA